MKFLRAILKVFKKRAIEVKKNFDNDIHLFI